MARKPKKEKEGGQNGEGEAEAGRGGSKLFQGQAKKPG